MNFYAIRAIYKFEMARTFRTLLQSIVTPVVSTSLYFVVFGAAIGSRITDIEGVSYGAFIVPGLIMLSLLTQSISNASFGPSSRERSTRSSPLPSPTSRSSSATSGRPRPSR
jgi:ABC-2 type transport system permease protein